MKFAKRQINKILNLFGFEIKKSDDKFLDLADISEEYKNIIRAVSHYTMTSSERVNALLTAVDYVVENNIDGDYVECGVWRGGSTMAAALRFMERANTNRRLYLYDTFEGMPAPSKYDFSKRSGHAQNKFDKTKLSENSSNWCYTALDDVKRNISLTSYPPKKVIYVKGKVEETIPAQMPEKIAILRLDTDWYASTKHEMENLFPLLVKGGVLIIDDYGHWEGCRKAVNEYFSDNKIKPPLLARVDYTGRIGIKQT